MPLPDPPQPATDRGRPERMTELLPVLAELPGHLLWRAHARVLLLIAQQLPPGVDLHSYATLLALADGRARSQQSLAETTTVSRTTMTRVATDLAAAGLVERVRNPDDRRSWALTRTTEGADAVRRWERHALDLEDAVSGPFSTAERRELRDLLVRVLRDEIPDDAPDELSDSLAYLVSRAHWRAHRDFLTALEPLGLEPRHFGALVALTATGPVAQTELARRLGLSAASVVQIADDLEGRGHARRQRAPADRRTHLLHVADHVPDLLTEARRAADGAISRLLGGLSPADRSRLVQLLQQFVTAHG